MRWSISADSLPSLVKETLSYLNFTRFSEIPLTCRVPQPTLLERSITSVLAQLNPIPAAWHSFSNLSSAHWWSASVEATSNVSSAKSRLRTSISSNLTHSWPQLRLLILSMKATNWGGDRMDPWPSPTRTSNRMISCQTHDHTFCSHYVRIWWLAKANHRTRTFAVPTKRVRKEDGRTPSLGPQKPCRPSFRRSVLSWISGLQCSSLAWSRIARPGSLAWSASGISSRAPWHRTS